MNQNRRLRSFLEWQNERQKNYTPCSEKRRHFISGHNFENLNQFSKFFRYRKEDEISNKTGQQFREHHKCVAILPYEMQTF